MRSSQVDTASDSQCRNRNCPEFDISILRQCGICAVADEAVLNKVLKEKKCTKNLFKGTIHKNENLVGSDIKCFTISL
jgi:hypothetical protein